MAQQQTVPTKPNTTYATVTPTSAGHDAETTDELLDEIDALLAEEDEFLTMYRQRGGQ